MAKGVTELLLKITGDNREAVKKLSEIDGKMTKTADNFMTAAKTMAAAFVASKIAGFGKDAIDAALRAEEAANKFDTVFGPSVEEAGRFVDDYATKLGMSTGELTGLMGSIGSVVSGVGAATGDIAGLSTDVATLGANLASFHDKGVDQAIQSIVSALTGERESLKTSFGIVVKEADVVRQALMDTGKDSAKELSELDKTMATLALITIKGKLQGAIGDLDRTMDDNVGQIRTLQGTWKQFQEDIGQQIIPVLEEILPVIQDVLPELGKLAKALIETVVPAFVDAVTAAGPFIDMIAWLAERGSEGMQEFREDTEEEMSLFDRALHGGGGALGNFFDSLTIYEQSKEFYAGIWDSLTGAANDFDEELRNATWAARWQGMADDFVERYGEGGPVPDALSNTLPEAFTEAQQSAKDNVEKMRARIDDLDQSALDSVGQWSEWETEMDEHFQNTVDLFETAAGQIEISMEEMLTNLADQVEQDQKWRAAIKTFIDMGMDDVAAALEKAGPEATSAFEQFITDPMLRAALELSFDDPMNENIVEMLRLLASQEPVLRQKGRDMFDKISLGLRERGYNYPLTINTPEWESGWVTQVGSMSARWQSQMQANLSALRFSIGSWQITVPTVHIPVTSGQRITPQAEGGISPGGLSLVGERGPEIIDLPSGTKVHTNHESRQMGLGGGVTVNVYGSVIAENDLADIVAKRLALTQRRNGFN